MIGPASSPNRLEPEQARSLAHRWRASSFSSFFRCCRYSLKQAFFSPNAFKAPYLHESHPCQLTVQRCDVDSDDSLPWNKNRQVQDTAQVKTCDDATRCR